MPLLVGEVSKLGEGSLRKSLEGNELGEIDSVKKVSILGDVEAGKLRVDQPSLKLAEGTEKRREASERRM